MTTVFANLFLGLFLMIDGAIYGLIDIIYTIIMKIANIAVISQAAMQAFAEKVYILIGVIMLFKVAFSLIQLFANPDKMNDSKIGASSLVKRIIISLILLTMAPTIFQFAFRLQGIILDQGILEKLILNSNVSADNTKIIDIDCDKEEYQTTRVCGGRTISFAIFKGFIVPDKKVIEEKDYTEEMEQYNEAVEKQDRSLLGDLVTEGKVGARPFNYTFLVSSIAGGFAAWLLFMFCFDVSIRAVKLTFLQLLAPIPIISYVDPNKGATIFKNWISQCISTYLEVFIKLISLYFVVYIIQEIAKNGMTFFEYTTTGATKTATGVGVLATAFIILGLLMFANQAPKWISEMFGVKSSGDFTMNPLKKLGQSPLITGAIGLGAGSAIGALTSRNAAKEGGGGKLKQGWSSLTGGITGAGRGAIKASGEKDALKAFGAGAEASTLSAKKIQSRVGTSIGGRNIARMQKMAFMKTRGEKNEDEIKAMSKYTGGFKKVKDAARSEALKSTQKGSTLKNGKKTWYDLNGALEAAKQGGNANSISAAQQSLDAWEYGKSNEIRDEWTQNYKDKEYDKITNADAMAGFTDMVDAYSDEPAAFIDDKTGTTIIGEDHMDPANIKKSADEVSKAQAKKQASEAYKEARDNDQYAKETVGPIFQTKGK